MTDQELINKTAEFMKLKFAEDPTGHDWWHLYRVWNLAKHIASKEKGADLLVVELAALLHDIADHKFNGGDMEIGAQEAGKWLKSIGAVEKTTVHVQEIVRNISFKTAKTKNKLETIGIARAMAFGGAHERLIYSPDIPIMEDYAFEKTNAGNSTGIHHFYEKLLLLKDRMLTETGRQMAIHRHEYMEKYLKEFYTEWDGRL